MTHHLMTGIALALILASGAQAGPAADPSPGVAASQSPESRNPIISAPSTPHRQHTAAADWPLDDPAWWLSTARHDRALELLDRIDRYYEAAHSNEDFARAVHGDPDLFDVAVSIQRGGDRASDEVTHLFVEVRGSHRPDLVRLGRLVEMYADDLQSFGAEAVEAIAKQRHNRARAGLGEESLRNLDLSVAEALQGFSHQRRQAKPEELRKAREELAKAAPADAAGAARQARRQLNKSAFAAARLFLLDLEPTTRDAVLGFLKDRVERVFVTQYGYLPVASKHGMTTLTPKAGQGVIQ